MKSHHFKKGGKFYKLKSIVDCKRVCSRGVQYLIKWNDNTTSWQPESNLNPEALNEAIKFSLLKNLEDNSIVEIRPSDIDGVGVFANRLIPKGTILFQFNCNPTHETVDFTPAEIETLNPDAQRIIIKFFLNENGYYAIPKHGIACALGMSFYINSSSQEKANVKFGTKIDLSGYREIIANRKICPNEELMLPYSLPSSTSVKPSEKD
jgi:hypothetical protein